MRTITTAALCFAALATAGAADAQQRDRRSDNQYDAADCGRGGAQERTRCAQARLAAADRRLNIVYQRMIVDAQAVDRREQRMRYTQWYGQEQALRGAQRAWIVMRDADCRYITQPDIGRRRQVQIANTLCQTSRTEERTAQLQGMRNQLRTSYDRMAQN